MMPCVALKVTLLVRTELGTASSLLATRVSPLTLLPVYTASTVSKSLPRVSIVTLPVLGACHRYQTDLVLVGLSGLFGSPASFVAAIFVPVTLPEHPLTTCALAKLSFGGGDGVGDGGGGGVPVGHPISFNRESVKS